MILHPLQKSIPVLGIALSFFLVLTCQITLYGQQYTERAQFSGSVSDNDFGTSVSIEGDYAVVGEPGFSSNTGRAIVYYQDPTNGWEEVAILEASDGSSDNRFGFSVSISDGIVVVGADGDNSDTGSAYVFEEPGGGWTGTLNQTTKLTASDGASDDSFGFTVSISGDAIAVGAPDENFFYGAVYMFEKSGGTWSQIAKLTGSENSYQDYFGYSVSLSGDVLVVGSENDDIVNATNNNTGTAYVFEKSGGSWGEVARFTSSDAAQNDSFGNAVSVSGEVIVVGTSEDDEPNGASGSAFIFEKSNGSWTQVAKLLPSDPRSAGRFGTSVSISGDIVVIGSTISQSSGVNDPGAGYLFEKPSSGWASGTEDVKIFPADGVDGDKFGNTFSISGSNVVAGAFEDDNNGFDKAGSAYFFSRQPFVELTASANPTNSSPISVTATFSSSVTGFDDVVNDIIVSGGSASNISGSGNTYTFDVTPSNTAIDAMITVDIPADAATDIYSDGNTAATQLILDYDLTLPSTPDAPDLDASSDLGISSEDDFTSDNTPTFSGVVEADATVELFYGSTSLGTELADELGNYNITATTIPDGSQNITITATDQAGNTSVASSVLQIDIETIAPVFTSVTDGGDGNYKRTESVTLNVDLSETGLTVTTDLTVLDTDLSTNAPFTDNADGTYTLTTAALGENMQGGDNLVISIHATDAAGNETIDNNLTLNLDITATRFEQAQKFSGAATYDYLGFSSAIDGDYAVVGANRENEALVYNFDPTNGWEHSATLVASDISVSDFSFGRSVAIEGETIVVGTYSSNAIYVYELSAGVWNETILTATDGLTNVQFGSSVHISGGTIVAGAFGVDEVATNAGAAYIFEKSGGIWSQTAKLTASDPSAEDQFGISVAVSEEIVVVGAQFDDDVAQDAGAAYVFEKPQGGWADMNETAKLTASDGASVNYFGYSAAIEEGTIVVGAYRATNAELSDGSVYVFEKPSGSWSQQAKLTASDAERLGQMGLSVAIEDGLILAGAPNAGAGSVYVFEEPTDGWATTSSVSKLTASDGEEDDTFGYSVAISGDHIVVGAWRDNTFAGSAYFFAGPPTVELSVAENPTNSNPIEVTANFGIPVTGFEASDITVSGGTLSAVSGSDRSYTFNVTPDNAAADGTIAVDVPAAVVSSIYYGEDNIAAPQLSIAYDITAPAKPGTPDLDAGSDLGNSDSDDLTSDNTPTFSGTGAEANGTVELFYGGTNSLGTAPVDGSGNYSITSDLIPDGMQQITIKAVDEAGNSSVASDELSIDVETSAPVFVAVTDAGNGFYKQGETITLDVDLGETVLTVSADLTVLDADMSSSALLTDDGDNTYSHTTSILGENLQEGTDISLTIIAVDAAGNETTNSSLALTIDNTAPTTPDAPDLDPGSDLGRSDSDNVTNDATPTFTGSVEANATVELFYDGSTSLGTTVADGSGNYNITATTIPDGQQNITVLITDQAGNASDASSALAVTIDTSVPSISLGTIAGDDVVSGEEDDDITVSGTTSGVEDNQTVSVTVNDGVSSVETTATVSSDVWSVSDIGISNFTNGPVTVTADVDDLAGNAAPQGSKSIELDNSSPTIAIGTIETDDIVNGIEDDDVTISGTTSGAEDSQAVTVRLTDGSTTLETTGTVSGDAWTAADVDISGLNNGSITVTADVSDAAGNDATQTSKIITLENINPSVTLTTSATTTNNNPIGVTATFNESVFDFVVGDLTVSGGAISNFSGSDATYTFDVTPSAEGTITVNVAADVATDGDGNSNIAATQLSMVYDNTAPTISIVTIAEDDQVNGSEDGDLAVSGTTSGAEDGQTVTVKLSDGTTSLETTGIVSNGEWTTTDVDISSLTNGEITVTADVSDVAGNNASQASRSISLDNVAPTISIATIAEDDVINGSEDEEVTVSGSASGAEDGQTVTITLSDGTTTLETTGTVGSDAWTANAVDINSLVNGEIIVTADVSDEAGNNASQGSHSISLDNVAPTISITTIAEGDVINGSEDEEVTVSGSASGAEDDQTVTITWSDGTITLETTGTVGSDAWAAKAVDINSLANGEITVTADVSDEAGNTATQNEYTITLDNISPVFSSDGTASIDENSAVSTEVYTAEATDTNGVTYSLSGTDEESFDLDETTGVLTFEESPDFETKSSYSITITATDEPGNSASQDIEVTINDVNETITPTFTSASEVSVDENDEEAFYSAVTEETATFSLGTSLDEALFTLNDASLSFTSAPNFESAADSDEDNVYEVEVIATHSSGGSSSITLDITVTDVNEAPNSISISSSSVDENVDAGTVVGELSSTDPDASFALSYSLADTETNFIIDGTELKTNVVFDFETQSSYDVVVTVTDEGSLTYEKTITIAINDVNESIATSSVTIAEIEAREVGSAPFELAATTDPEDATIVWSVVEGSATIDGSTLTPGSDPGLVVVKAIIEATNDYEGSEDTESFNLTDPTLIDPVLEITLPAEAAINETVTVEIVLDAQGATTITAEEVVLTVESGPGVLSGNVLSFTADGTVTVNASLEATSETNAVSVQAQMEAYQVFSVSGSAIDTDGNEFSNGEAFLIANDNFNETINAVLGTDGTFTFVDVREGEYYLGVGVPQSETTYLTTYFGDISPVLDPADSPVTLKLASDMTGLIINMQSKPAPAITFTDPEDGGSIEFQAQGATGGENRFVMGRVHVGDPIPNTQVILSTTEGAYIADGLTDQEGYITFDGLPTGDYKIGVVIPGVGTVETEIPVEEGKQADITGLISEDGTVALEVATVLDVEVESQASLNIYPNPAENELNLQLEHEYQGSVLTQIFDLNGRLVQSFHFEKSSYQVNIQERLDIPGGTYLLLLRVGDSVLQHRLMKR